jgi:uncharacterized SAM-binding protein YcdF (DUF218 family)
MKQVLQQLLILPMPFLWLSLIGLIFSRTRLGRIALFAGASIWIVFALPVTGRALLHPLIHNAPFVENGLNRESIKAVIVPTAGSFQDIDGGWWSGDATIDRVLMGKRMHEQFGGILFLSGGSLNSGQPGEAITATNQLDLKQSKNLFVDGAARNSFETVENFVAENIANKGDRIILVTDGEHVARMAALLRKHGFAVTASIVGKSVVDVANRGIVSGVEDFIPSAVGIFMVNKAMREYVAILSYLARGRFSLSDLAD